MNQLLSQGPIGNFYFDQTFILTQLEHVENISANVNNGHEKLNHCLPLFEFLIFSKFSTVNLCFFCNWKDFSMCFI